jgi:hypothetical protein
MIDPQHEIEHWSEFDRGRHFAAMVDPGPAHRSVGKFFRTLR